MESGNHNFVEKLSQLSIIPNYLNDWSVYAFIEVIIQLRSTDVWITYDARINRVQMSYDNCTPGDTSLTCFLSYVFPDRASATKKSRMFEMKSLESELLFGVQRAVNSIAIDALKYCKTGYRTLKCKVR